jgi:hypothetical protein
MSFLFVNYFVALVIILAYESHQNAKKWQKKHKVRLFIGIVRYTRKKKWIWHFADALWRLARSLPQYLNQQNEQTYEIGIMKALMQPHVL